MSIRCGVCEESTFLTGLGCPDGDVVDQVCKLCKVPWAVH